MANTIQNNTHCQCSTDPCLTDYGYQALTTICDYCQELDTLDAQWLENFGGENR